MTEKDEEEGENVFQCQRHLCFLFSILLSHLPQVESKNLYTSRPCTWEMVQETLVIVFPKERSTMV